MLQPVRCIKFGEILLDENRRMLLLCSQCHSDYEQLHDFQQHLDYCRMGAGSGGAATQSIFADNVSLVFPVANESHHLLGRYAKENQEFQVYKYNGFKRLEVQNTEPSKSNAAEDEFMDLIKIEEELLDPRWYTELSSAHIIEQTDANTSHHQTASYNELVEAVTPFVQFKENLKSNESHTKVFQHLKQPTSVKNQLLNGGKTRISATFTEPQYRDNANMKPNTGIMQRRLPTLAANKTLANVSSNNVVKIFPIEQLQHQPNNSNTLETYSYVTKPKQPLEKPQPQQKRRIVKFLLTNTTTNTPTVETPAMCQPSTLSAPIFKTEHQVNAIKEKPTMVEYLNDTSYSFNTHLQTSTHEISAPPTKTIQTQQILNKLQTLGLQVKRKQPIIQQQPQPSAATTTHDPAKEKTLQLLKKLQSKGMNVKIVQSSKQASNNNNTVQQLEVPKRAKLETNANNDGSTQTVPLRSKLIIRKLN